MKVETDNISNLIAGKVSSFFIPPYQRAYAWGKPQLTRFFEDIMRIIKSELDTKQPDKQEHFFGTVVGKNEDLGWGETRTVIIDGQQRITTTLLYLIALRDLTEDEGRRDKITHNFLTSPHSGYDCNIKLKQVTRDWEAYKALVLSEGKPIPGNVTSAYRTFKALITNAMKLNPEITFEHLVNALSKLNIAEILLDERPFKGEDPQIIFETLNSLGKPLTLSDLIRNFVLLNMESAKQTKIYEKMWFPKIEQPLGDATSSFFRDYLQLKTASSLNTISDNNTKELYRQFKDYVSGSFETHEQLINDLVSYVDSYRYIIDPEFTGAISSDSEIKELVLNIFHDIKSEAFKPLVMGLLRTYATDEDRPSVATHRLKETLEGIRTYLIRRRVVKQTQGENKAIPPLCAHIEALYGGSASILDLLSSLFYRLRIPNDNEIVVTLRETNFYKELYAYVKFILGKMEEHRSKVSVNFRDNRITIEHIMPQTLSEWWRDYLGPEAEEIQGKYLHNIGNLILTEFNFEVGNCPFEEKKRRLNDSNLSYRKDIISQEDWREDQILEHRKQMIDLFLETFPLPEERRNADNWRSDDSPIAEQFSPLDDGQARQYYGTKPISIRVNDTTIPAKTWRDVFLRFVKHITEEHITDMDYLTANQKRLNQGYEVFRKWGDLKNDHNALSQSRYKTLAGKYWTKVSELDDDMIFVHVNISAYTCILRIATLMEDLGMKADDVTIAIKQ